MQNANKILYRGAFIFFSILAVIFLASSGYEQAWDSPHYSETNTGTISGTEADTITVDFLCQSLWTYQHSFYGVEDTATMEVKIDYQVNDFDTGHDSDWRTVESDTLKAGKNPLVLSASTGVSGLAYVKGKRNRYILTGLDGTQDVTYTARTILKQPSK